MDDAVKAKVEEGIMLPLMEEFYTIQGEGYHTGKAAYFIRIGGCDVGCHWCDVKESWNADLHPPTEIEGKERRSLFQYRCYYGRRTLNLGYGSDY